MRRFALTALLLAPALAAAQPSAADSALVHQVVDAFQMEQSFDALMGPMSQMAKGLPGATGDLFNVDAIDDSLRVLLLADVRREALSEGLAYLRSPAYEASLAFAARNAEQFASPGGLAAFEERVQNPKKGALADEALSRRYVRAMGLTDRLPDMMRRLFTALAETAPALAATMEAEGGIEAALQPFESEYRAELDSMQVAQMRVALFGFPEDALAASVAFYESPAGAYLNDAASEATFRVMIPALAAFMAEMVPGGMEDVEVYEVDRDGSPPPADREVYEVVEVQPELIGGLAALQAAVVYPEMARRAGIEGQVVVQFIVDTDGSVTDPVVLRSPDPLLADAALAAVAGSQFTPGQMRGRPVRVRFAVPITFRLTDPEPTDQPPLVAPSAGDPPEVRPVREEAPRLIGGLAGLARRTVYPEDARQAGVEGRVVVQFVVTEDGRVETPTVLSSPDPRLSQAALAAVRASRFEPGRIDGQPVRVRFSLPVSFSLR